MRLFDFFRGRRPISELGGLGDFIDENAAFITQKGIFEYSRMRAGHYAKVLFSEPEFQVAVERSRWLAFPVGLAMVGEVVDGVLRAVPTEGQGRQQKALRGIVVGVLDRYPKPVSMDASEWLAARADLDRRMQSIGSGQPKRSYEVADQLAQPYFDLMPIHEKLRARDFPTMHNYLRLTLCNIHIELTKRIDADRVRDLLTVHATSSQGNRH